MTFCSVHFCPYLSSFRTIPSLTTDYCLNTFTFVVNFMILLFVSATIDSSHVLSFYLLSPTTVAVRVEQLVRCVFVCLCPNNNLLSTK